MRYDNDVLIPDEQGPKDRDALNDRRRFVRMPFMSKALCHVGSTGREHLGTIRDISMVGLYLELQDRPEDGCQCTVKIYFQGEHSRLVIEKVTGEIVRCEDAGVAIRFDHRLEWFVLIPIYFYKIRDQEQTV